MTPRLRRVESRRRLRHDRTLGPLQEIFGLRSAPHELGVQMHVNTQAALAENHPSRTPILPFILPSTDEHPMTTGGLLLQRQDVGHSKISNVYPTMTVKEGRSTMKEWIARV